MAILLNRQRLSEALGVSPRTVDEYTRRGMPSVKTGGQGKVWEFDLAQCVAWIRADDRRRSGVDEAALDLDEARRRKLAAEAALAEYDLAEKRGDVVTIDSVVKQVTGDYTRLRTKLLAIPSKLAPLVAVVTTPEEARAILDGAIEEALSELATGADDGIDCAGGDLRPADPDEAGTGRRAPAAAEADGQRVGRPRKKAQPRGKRGAGAVVHAPS